MSTCKNKKREKRTRKGIESLYYTIPKSQLKCVKEMLDDIGLSKDFFLAMNTIGNFLKS